jgi:hypothetical protein
MATAGRSQARCAAWAAAAKISEEFEGMRRESAAQEGRRGIACVPL